MTKHLLPVFHHDFKIPVWQMALEPERGLLALEIRDQGEAEVSFSLFNFNTRLLDFDRYALEEDWWVSLAGLRKDKLLIKQYHDSQQPEKQGLIAINVETREADWWLDDFQLDELAENELTGLRVKNGEQVKVTLSLENGNEVFLKNFSSKPLAANAWYPVHYTASDSHFLTVSKFLAGAINAVPVSACDYLEVGRFIILSYFISEGATLSNEVLVVTVDGDQLLQQNIGRQLTAVASGTFFVFNNYLVFIANKTQLCVYELPTDF